MEIRGGLQACARQGSDRFSLGFRAGIDFEGIPRPFAYEIVVRSVPSPRIVAETLSLTDENRFIFSASESDQSADLLDVQYDNFERGPHKPKVTVTGNRSVLSQYPVFAVKNRKRDACTAAVQEIQAHLPRSFVFDPSPKLMRSYERIGNRTLSRDGANLSAVLYALQQGTAKEQEALGRILASIQQIPEEPYSGFRFVTTDLNDVIFGLVRSSDGALVDARVLSDGTLRILAVLTAMETAGPASRVVIEELDNGLHPSRVRILTTAIEEVCARRELNVLATTHNPATLDSLSPKQLNGVQVCFWDQAVNATRLVGLTEMPRADELLERGRLGDLVTRRVLEQYLSPKMEEERRRKFAEWLESLS